MRRTITIVMILLCVLIRGTVVLADDSLNDNMVNIIENISPCMNEDKTIKRSECIASIMKLVGVDKDTADIYREALWHDPIFYDVDSDEKNAGYIFRAKLSGVAVGVNLDIRAIGDFEPNREITIKE